MSDGLIHNVTFVFRFKLLCLIIYDLLVDYLKTKSLGYEKTLEYLLSTKFKNNISILPEKIIMVEPKAFAPDLKRCLLFIFFFGSIVIFYFYQTTDSTRNGFLQNMKTVRFSSLEVWLWMEVSYLRYGNGS